MNQLASESRALLAWDNSAGLCLRPLDDGELLAADSWLVHDGRCRGLSMHWARFLLGCRARVAQLQERECWVVNALHGIRAVSCWADPAMTAGQPQWAAIWQALLERGAEPLPRQADQRGGAPLTRGSGVLR